MSNINHITVFEDQTEGITTDGIKLDISDIELFIGGEWDGATVKVEGSPNGEIWFEDADGSFTADAWKVASFGEIFIRFTLEDAGASTSLSAYIRPRQTHVITQ